MAGRRTSRDGDSMTRDIHDVVAQYDGTVIEELESLSSHSVYDVRVDGERAVCKVAGEDGEDAVALDAALLEYVHRETSVPVSRVVRSGTDHFLASWVAGETYDGGMSHVRRTQRLTHAGAMLARLHEAVEFDAHGRFTVETLPRDQCGPIGGVSLDAVGRWDEMLRSIVGRWRRDLPDRFVEVGGAVYSFVGDHRWLFADEPATLVHGDYAGHNLLFDGDDVAAVLDWELAFSGAGEFDLCRAEQVLFGGEYPTEPDGALREALWGGYESVRPPDAESEARRAVYRAVLALNPLRHVDEWTDEIDRETWGEYLTERAREQLGIARGRLEVPA